MAPALWFACGIVAALLIVGLVDWWFRLPVLRLREQHFHVLRRERDELAVVAADQGAELKSASKARRSNDARARRALELEGAIWMQRTMSGTPKFAPLEVRRTPIISVLNLKGGVGKTTITAYLAHALSVRGYRVLLVDLDLQGSLSNLFIPRLDLPRRAAPAEDGGKFLHHLLAPPPGAGPGKLMDHTLEIPKLGRHARIVPTTDKLAYAELSLTVRWLLRIGGTSRSWNGRRDGRMILRRALHKRSAYRKFDVVLLDCPPLINLSCANALAASDFVLAPVTPSVKSIERVPALLKRMLEVQADVNPQLQMLGYVINSTRQKALQPHEKDLFQTLPQQCAEVYGRPVDCFDTTIPNRVAVRNNEEEFRPLPEGSDIQSVFEQLAEEFLKRLPEGCRQPEDRRRKGSPQ